MRLTQFTDYSLRVLLYLGLKNDKATANEVAQNFKISRNHLTKVIHRLGQKGYLKTLKGKGGGFRLAVDPRQVKIGDFISATEPDLHLVECFDRQHNTCPISGFCGLEKLLYSAQSAFLTSLNQKTLADLLQSHGAAARKQALKLSV